MDILLKTLIAIGAVWLLCFVGVIVMFWRATTRAPLEKSSYMEIGGAFSFSALDSGELPTATRNVPPSTYFSRHLVAQEEEAILRAQELLR